MTMHYMQSDVRIFNFLFGLYILYIIVLANYEKSIKKYHENRLWSVTLLDLHFAKKNIYYYYYYIKFSRKSSWRILALKTKNFYIFSTHDFKHRIMHEIQLDLYFEIHLYMQYAINVREKANGQSRIDNPVTLGTQATMFLKSSLKRTSQY